MLNGMTSNATRNPYKKFGRNDRIYTNVMMNSILHSFRCRKKLCAELSAEDEPFVTSLLLDDVRGCRPPLFWSGLMSLE